MFKPFILWGLLKMNLKEKAINNLIKRRKALQEQYDELIAEPASYGITGSVNASNRGLSEIRQEIVAIDKKISSLLGNGVAGMTIKLPCYRCGEEGLI